MHFYVLDLNWQLEGGVGATLGGCGVTCWSLRTSGQWTLPEIAFQSGKSLNSVWTLNGAPKVVAHCWHLQACLSFLALPRLLCHYKGANRSESDRSKNTGSQFTCWLIALLCIILLKIHRFLNLLFIKTSAYLYHFHRLDTIKASMLWRRTLTWWPKMPKHTMNQDLRFSR